MCFFSPDATRGMQALLCWMKCSNEHRSNCIRFPTAGTLRQVRGLVQVVLSLRTECWITTWDSNAHESNKLQNSPHTKMCCVFNLEINQSDDAHKTFSVRRAQPNSVRAELGRQHIHIKRPDRNRIFWVLLKCSLQISG